MSTMLSMKSAFSERRSKKEPLRIGTRSSALALWQARHVAARLEACGVTNQLIPRQASGDRNLSVPISELRSDAPFADELVLGLRDGEFDLVVHSLKDLPTIPRDDLVIAAVLERGDPREALVLRNGENLSSLAPGAIVGTSSPRRAAQIQALRSDLRTAPIRGPVDERLRQVRAGRFDAVVLAAAGLHRLGLEGEIAEYFSIEEFLPAPAQAVLAVQVRSGDECDNDWCALLEHPPTRTAVTAELEFIRHFEPDPGMMVSAYATASSEVRIVAALHATSGLLWRGDFKDQNPLMVAARAAECARSLLMRQKPH